MDAHIEQLETEYLRKLMQRDAAVWRERARRDERQGAPADGWGALKSPKPAAEPPRPGVRKGTPWTEARRKAQKRGKRAGERGPTISPARRGNPLSVAPLARVGASVRSAV